MDMPKIDIGNLRLSHSPLINRLHMYEWQTNPRLQELLDIESGNNLTDIFMKDLQWRARKEHNFVVEIKGIRGSGKSFLARGIKGYADSLRGKKSSINDIVFTRQEYMDDYSKAKPGQTFIIDEDFGFQTQTGSMRIRESMMLAEQTFRIEEISTIACSVAPSYSHLYDFYLLAFDYDEEMGVNRALVFNTSQLGGLFAKPVGFILFPSSRYINPAVERAYREKKREFTKRVKQGQVRTLQQDYDTYAEDCIKEFGWEDIKPTKSMMNVYLRRKYPQMANTEREDIIETLMVRMFEIHGSSKGKKKKEGRDDG